jgi:hypothetical protein
VLLAAAQNLPTPAGATSGGGFEGAIYDEFSGVAGLSFHSALCVVEITSFYQEELTASGWIAEGEPHYWSVQDVHEDPEEQKPTLQIVTWSFVKGDLRLLIGAQLNPGYVSMGEIPWSLTVQPIWFPTSENNSVIPGSSVENTPILRDEAPPNC